MSAPREAPPLKDFACVIPCYNAGHRLKPVVEAALAQVGEVWVVDDGSTDGCVAALAELPVRVVSHTANLGKGHAILAGLRAALEGNAAAVALLDADGQHDSAALPLFHEKWLALQPDLVIGERIFDGRHVPLRSRFGNAVTAACTRLLLGANLSDTQCGYRLLSRTFAQEVLQHVAGGRYETEMEMLVLAIRRKKKIATVPISTLYEPGNASSHFRKIPDSFRIYKRLLSAALSPLQGG